MTHIKFPPVPTKSTFVANSPKSLLFQPLKIRGVTFKNRITVSPMCQYSSIDGFSNTWHITHLGQYATRGAGLIIVEASAVQPRGRISPQDLGLWKDEHIAGLKTITDFAHTQGAKIGIQLAHAGRKASTYSPFHEKQGSVSTEDGGWPDDVIGPTDQQDSGWAAYPTPRQASIEDIKQVIKDFGVAAARAEKAGFDVIEIHGAHGYLINSFLSPLVNTRTDEYGGSWENRVKILYEVVDEVRKVWPQEKPLFVRLSATDWADGGWTGEDTVKLSQSLAKRGVDLIDISSGGNVSKTHGNSYQDGWNLPFSERVVSEVPDILVGVVGGIKNPIHAESILQEKKAHLILIAREFLRNPSLVEQAGRALGEDFNYPLQYARAKAV